MNEPGKAVFLSYASQDAEAARRIAEALRGAGVEVWFDQSELRGGDAWDHKIRTQIKECTLFLPIISAHTQARLEGYFRREWRLAVDRMHDMDDTMPFLVPVVIDDTPDAAARVPERFKERQWTRLLDERSITEFARTVRTLLAPDARPIDRGKNASRIPTDCDPTLDVFLGTLTTQLGHIFTFFDGQSLPGATGLRELWIRARNHPDWHRVPLSDSVERERDVAKKIYASFFARASGHLFGDVESVVGQWAGKAQVLIEQGHGPQSSTAIFSKPTTQRNSASCCILSPWYGRRKA